MSGSTDQQHERGPVRRVLGNLGALVRGRALAALMMLGATALMARALGPAGFGVVMLIRSYALLMRGVFNSRTSDTVVRYGVPAHEAGDLRTLRRLLKVCHRTDRLVAVAATVVAIVLAPFIGPLMGVGHAYLWALVGFSVALLTTANSTADGILRVFDRFDALSWQITIDGAISLVGTVIAWWFGSPLWVFVAIMAVAYATREVYLSWCGWRVYRQRVGPAPDAQSLRHARLSEFPGLRHFLWVTYWQYNMDLVPRHLSVVLVGSLLGATGAGLLRVTQQLSGSVSKLAVLIRQVVFPDVTRSRHRGTGTFHRVTQRTALYAGVLGLALVVAMHFGGAALLGALFGHAFVAAAHLLTLMMLAAAFDLIAAPLRSAAYAIGHAGKILAMYALSMAIYLALFVTLTGPLGLSGIGVAACVAAVLDLAFIATLVYRDARRTA